MTDPRDRGWSDDVDVRGGRRPKQVIEYENYRLTLTPSWRYGCTGCDAEKEISSESPWTWDFCRQCEEVTQWEPLGELRYPVEEPSDRDPDPAEIEAVNTVPPTVQEGEDGR
jgi:hypothetical protein